MSAAGPIFYDPRQSVTGVDSFSPSAGKPARLMALLVETHGEALAQRVTTFNPVTRDELCLVHDSRYVDDVFAGRVLNGFETRDPRVPEACLWTIGSLVGAVRAAAGGATAFSPTSGFHHAGHAWGGGYCTFNGLMVATALYLRAHPKAMVGILDCDYHYGDGTTDILKHYPSLARRVIHRTSGSVFREGSRDSPLEFFAWLHHSIEDLNDFGCDVVIYQAGADMHIKDPLGGLLTDGEMQRRDRMVFEGIDAGIAWNLAGGYRGGSTGSFEDDPVLRTHLTTLGEADRAS